MRGSLTRIGLAVLGAFAWLVAQAEVVHVRQVTSAGGVESVIVDELLETGADYQSWGAPTIRGYIFTHWSISRDQAFVNRDDFGRARDFVTYHLYEDTTLTANYVSEKIDSDNDGIADGNELYWYGTLDVDASTDTDGDGFGFSDELQNKTNPHFADGFQTGEVVYGDGSLMVFNPHGYAQYVFKSEPEGCLFKTETGYVVPGTALTTPSYKNQDFAYWKVGEGLSALAQDGVSAWTVKRDPMGRAVDSFSFAMPSNYIEVVAVSSSDPEERQKLYWYGSTEVSMSSDTDGDGFTFAEEVANGTNPLFADGFQTGEIVYGDGPLMQFNPYNMHAYKIRSEPEGRLFATHSDYVRPGTEISTGGCGSDSKFAYWTYNGAQQRDALGRALDSLTFTMPTTEVEVVAVSVNDADERAQLYWYGAATPMTSDTDGDGFTLSEELANGTNPLFADGYQTGEIVYGDGSLEEVNRQPYEKVGGFVVGGKLASLDVDRAVSPVVFDINGDGLFDIILVSDDGNRIYVNVGTSGNPEFVRNDAADISAVDLDMNSTAKLAQMDLDVQPINALSATVADGTLLVSDVDGRIWYYLNGKLQHKVWGGSRDGFATGLKLAAVDWDDDGDLDCLCGTADGKLMLLRDPKIGRPTNLKALVGVDNVKLDWDPNQQSRIRGYRVYRADADAEDFTSLVSPYTPLPTYRDYPPSVSDFDYKVSSVSRHYVAGNSAPVVSESLATEPVRVSLGKVSLHWTDVVVKRGETFSLMLSIDNSANLSPEGMVIEIEYDHTVLNLLKTLPSGLFEQSKIAPGSGKLYEYVFEIVDGEQGAVETSVSVKGATMYGVGGATVGVALPEKNAVVSIAAGGSAPYQLGDLNGDGKVDTLDLRELAKLKSAAGRKWTANQLKAGDFNGNGKLDEADYQALRDLLKEKGLL